MFIVTFVVYEKDGMDRAEALRYWREVHGPIDAKIPGVQRYVQQHAVGAPDGQPPFLGVASLTFADQDAFGSAATSRVRRRSRRPVQLRRRGPAARRLRRRGRHRRLTRTTRRSS